MKLIKPSPGLIAEFKAVVAQLPRAQPRKMFGYDAAFVNGNMAVGLWANTCVLKLAEADREQLLKRGHAVPFMPGKNMKMGAWLELSEELANDPEELLAWSARAIDYVATLPPKALKAQKPPAKKPLAKKASAKKASAKKASAKKASAKKPSTKGARARR
jgi:TfoX/Sxy family transcriptional regulator of competence genes